MTEHGHEFNTIMAWQGNFSFVYFRMKTHSKLFIYSKKKCSYLEWTHGHLSAVLCTYFKNLKADTTYLFITFKLPFLSQRPFINEDLQSLTYL